VLSEATGPAKKRLKDLTEYCRKGRLIPKDGIRDFHVAEFQGEARVRRLSASGNVEMPFVPANFSVWLGKRTPWVVVFDAGRRLAAAANAILGDAVSSDATAVKSVSLAKPVFAGLKRWAASRSEGAAGSILRATLQSVTSGRASFRQVVLRAESLESSPIFNDFFASAQTVSNMTFSTPKLTSASRSVCCKLSYWGSITLYTPEVLDSEIEELLAAVDESYSEL
jgi:hypothetical protein